MGYLSAISQSVLAAMSPYHRVVDEQGVFHIRRIHILRTHAGSEWGYRRERLIVYREEGRTDRSWYTIFAYVYDFNKMSLR